MSRQIGLKLKSCANLPVVFFLSIEKNLPHLENKNDLSADQKYLMDMYIAVLSESFALDLPLRNPEKIAHSGSLTLANCVLRLHVATGNPTENLKTLTEKNMKEMHFCGCVN